LDANGDVYVAGYYSDTVDFDPGGGTSNLTSAGSSDAFLIKFDNNGNFIWIKGVGGTSSDRGYNVAVDGSGNIYWTGLYSDTVDFDPGPGTSSLTSTGSNDVFVSKFDSSGNFLWAKSMGGVSDDESFGIAIDGSGSVFAIGYFSETNQYPDQRRLFGHLY
jgi:hypothetical protein